MTVTKEVVSISEMARMLGLSRARLYQLIKQGVLPQPIRNGQVKRAHYDRNLQEQCIKVRKTNCGINGEVILFYSSKPVELSDISKRPNRKQPSKPVKKKTDVEMDALRHDLEQLGVTMGSEADIRNGLASCFPDGHKNVNRQAVIMSLFEQFNRQNSHDNQA